MHYRKAKGIFRSLVCTVALCYLLACYPVYGQDKTNVQKSADSTWIEKFDDKIIIKGTIINTADALVAQGDGFKNVISPNPSERFRTYFNYRFISFYLDYIPHFLPGNNDNDVKGKTKGTGFGTNLNFRTWFADVGFSKTKGYYLENTKDFRPDWKPGDPYFQIPDLYVTSFEGDIGYNTNPRLSLIASSFQTERQLKSAGAFLPKLSFGYHIIDNRTPGTFSTQKSSHLQGLLGAGYQHTLVLSKSVYLTGAFTPSFGYIFSSVLTRETAQRYTFSNRGPIYQWDGKLGIGYNGHKVFGGTYLTAVSSTYGQGLTTAVDQSGTVFLQIFLGIRLSAPRFMSKALRKIVP